MKRKGLFALAAMLIIFSAAAVEAYYGNIEMYDWYNITGVNRIETINISASGFFIGNGSLLTDVSTSTANYSSYANRSFYSDYTYNATYDAKPSADTDTNASTKCTGAQLLNGDNTCVGYTGWDSGGTMNNTYNSSYEWFDNATIFQTYNSTYDTADAKTLDSYDSAFFNPLNKSLDNATKLNDDVMLIFGTGNDVVMYFNGTHFVIESA